MAKKSKTEIQRQEDEIKGLRRNLVDTKHSAMERKFEWIRRANISTGTSLQRIRKEVKADKSKLEEEEEKRQTAEAKLKEYIEGLRNMAAKYA